MQVHDLHTCDLYGTSPAVDKPQSLDALSKDLQGILRVPKSAGPTEGDAPITGNAV
jgi:hypothetical protein